MTTKILTPQDAIAVLEQVVALKGADYVYPEAQKTRMGGCLYKNPFDQQTPACMIAYAEYQTGGVDALWELTENVAARSQPNPEAESDEESRRYSYAVSNVLAAAQSAQDNGATWGEALVDAREAYEFEMCVADDKKAWRNGNVY